MKEIYDDSQYFQEPQEMPPEYGDDKGIDYVLGDEDKTDVMS